jgi:hypothetical protein
MNLNDKENKIFINSELLNNEQGVYLLHELFTQKQLLNHTTINEIGDDGNLVIVPPTLAQQTNTLASSSFVYFVEQKIMDGYLYGSVCSFKSLIRNTISMINIIGLPE